MPEGKRDGPVKGETNLKSALERCSVIVARAPKGMSRSKANATRWTKGSRSIQWTVEWVHPDGRKELGQCQEKMPILEAYSVLPGAPGSVRPKKRKRTNNRQEDDTERRKPPANGDALPLHQDAESGVFDLARAVEESVQAQGQDAGVGETGNVKSQKSTDAQSNSQKKEDTPSVLQHQEQQQRQQFLPNISFYLHTPSLPSRHPVLAPLSHDTTLSTTLRNRLVLEFPTIYVFDKNPQDKLPDGFISEEDFYKMARKEIIEELDEGEIVEEASPARREQQCGGLEAEKMDERKLMEVLGKDLGNR